MSVSRVVGVHEVPEDVRTLGSLPRIDYADRFVLATDVDATPEQWARAMFGDVASVAEWCIWRGVLGLRLSRGRSPVTVGGKTSAAVFSMKFVTSPSATPGFLSKPNFTLVNWFV